MKLTLIIVGLVFLAAIIVGALITLGYIFYKAWEDIKERPKF